MKPDVEKRIRDCVISMFRRHDLSTTTFEETIDKIVEVCIKEVDNHEGLDAQLECEASLSYFVLQIILETYSQGNSKNATTCRKCMCNGCPENKTSEKTGMCSGCDDCGKPNQRCLMV